MTRRPLPSLPTTATLEIALLHPEAAAQTDSAAQAISPGEFLVLYDEYYGRVYNYIRYRCADAAVSDDLTAATFERALNHLENYDPQRGPFGPWLFAIARSIVSNHLRLERRRAWLSLDDLHEQPANDPLPEETLLHSEAQTALLGALQTLDDRQRDLLSLKFAARFTNRRIAEITGLGESHVGVLIYRALNKLRQHMG